MYLYILNRPSFHDEIACMEFLCLTGTRTNKGFAISERFIDSRIPAYIDSCAKILFVHSSQDSLFSDIKNMNYIKDKYRVRFINTGVHIEFDQRKKIEKNVSDIFDGSPNLKNPDDDFIITYTGDKWLFGKMMWEAENRWLLYNKKPNTFCSSLPDRMARALVNIASYENKGKKFIDPCCGMGNVLLQAIDMGFDAYGCDINPTVVRKANANLEYFGFKPVIECKDAANISGQYDVSVVDLPYGVLSQEGSDRYIEIINNLRKICTQAVILSGEDISKIINSSGFEIIETCIVHKGGLDRHIALCR